jgi:hypothetical protein
MFIMIHDTVSLVMTDAVAETVSLSGSLSVASSRVGA